MPSSFLNLIPSASFSNKPLVSFLLFIKFKPLWRGAKKRPPPPTSQRGFNWISPPITSSSTDNGRKSRLSFFYRISNHKIFIPKYLDNALKLQHRGGYWRKKLPWTILEKHFPVPRNTAASKISNGVISLFDNSDVIATMIITNFHLYLIRLW